MVDEILSLVEGSDGGDLLTDETKRRVDALISTLALQDTSSTPLTDPTLIDNYEVVYSSTMANGGQQGAPAGGGFRGKLGKSLFKTTGLFQSLLAGGVAVNKVSFLVLGVLRGWVALRGTVRPYDNGKTADIVFDPPIISILGLIVRIGPRSTVTITTPFLSDRIRLGVGSRGSLFVFRRGGESNKAEMDKAGQESSTPASLFILFALFGLLLLSSCGLWVLGISHPFLRVLSLIPAFLGLAFASIFFKGGIQGDSEPRKDTK